jgi:methionyl-tRNA formyltransferase
MRILFLGTSEFALPAVRLLANGGWDLMGVVTQPDRPRGRGLKPAPTPVKQFALEHGLAVYQPESAAALAGMLEAEAIRPEIIVVVAFGQLLGQQVLDLPPLGCVNIHPSLLPAYRGPAPIQRAVLNGDTVTGVTIMFMSPEMDAGDIIMQKAVPIDPDMTCGELEAVLAELGAELLSRSLSLIAGGRAPRRAQEPGQATYAPALASGEEEIDWSQDAVTLYNKVRGMNPRPGARTLCHGKGLKIWSARALEGDSKEQPGHICSVDPGAGFTVQTGKGRFLALEVQPAGRRRMSGAEFARGYRIAPGLLLGG